MTTCTDRSEELGKLIRGAASQADAVVFHLIMEACTAGCGTHLSQARERRETRPRDDVEPPVGASARLLQEPSCASSILYTNGKHSCNGYHA